MDNFTNCFRLSSDDILENRKYGIDGFQEVIFSVRNLDKSSQMYSKLAGWQEVYRGACSEDQLEYWELPKDCRAEEALLINPGDNEGFLRLICFKNIKQRHIRSSGQSWDTGGIYDIDVRVKNLEKCMIEFQEEGWLGYNDPLYLKQRHGTDEHDAVFDKMAGVMDSLANTATQA